MSSPSVAIATCAEAAGVDNDDLQVIASLRRRGIEAVHAVWDDRGVDWSSFDLVVIRSTWDYSDRWGDFLAWASRLPRVLNPLPIVQWNVNKRYLDDLARAGLPVIPTRFLEPGDAFEPPSWAFVVKPSVSCSAKDTAWYPPDDVAKARDHVQQLQARGRTVMIQPYVSTIEAVGEVSVMFVGGVYSHAICRNASLKHPGLPGEGVTIRLSVDVYENVRTHAPTHQERSVAERVAAYLQTRSADLLYARVDLIADRNGEPIILEVELTEPTLFLTQYTPGGVERLVDCITATLANPSVGTLDGSREPSASQPVQP